MRPDCRRIVAASKDLLRNVGKHFSVASMLSKDSVRSRLSDPHGGISFTEFAYQLLQAYDFYVLHRDFGVCVQLGGSDQVPASMQATRAATSSLRALRASRSGATSLPAPSLCASAPTSSSRGASAGATPDERVTRTRPPQRQRVAARRRHYAAAARDVGRRQDWQVERQRADLAQSTPHGAV